MAPNTLSTHKELSYNNSMKDNKVIPCDATIGKVNKGNPTFKSLNRLYHVVAFYNSTNCLGDDILRAVQECVDKVSTNTLTIRDNKSNTHDLDWSEVEYYIIKHVVGG